MTDARTHEAIDILGEIEDTLATLNKMVADIDPALCVDADFAKLNKAACHLELAETALAEVCAENVERQEDE